MNSNMQNSNFPFVFSVISISVFAVLIFSAGKHVELMYIKANMALPAFTIFCWKMVAGIPYSLFCIISLLFITWMRFSSRVSNESFVTFNTTVLAVHLLLLALLFWGVMLPFAAN
jgi:hypothetical protein